jgi:hypothetical protein
MNATDNEMLTTREAGAVMGVVAARVRQLAGEELIPGARKYGRDWMIPKDFAIAFRREKRGRPRNPE